MKSKMLSTSTLLGATFLALVIPSTSFAQSSSAGTITIDGNTNGDLITFGGGAALVRKVLGINAHPEVTASAVSLKRSRIGDATIHKNNSGDITTGGAAKAVVNGLHAENGSRIAGDTYIANNRVGDVSSFGLGVVSMLGGVDADATTIVNGAMLNDTRVKKLVITNNRAGNITNIGGNTTVNGVRAE